MIKEILFEVVMSNIDLGDRRKDIISRYINTYNNEQLYYALQSQQGLVVDDLNIYFYPNAGFRCFNNPKYGKLPITNIYQRILNEKYTELTQVFSE